MIDTHSFNQIGKKRDGFATRDGRVVAVTVVPYQGIDVSYANVGKFTLTVSGQTVIPVWLNSAGADLFWDREDAVSAARAFIAQRQAELDALSAAL
jgi:hypothetical protein